MLQVPRGNLPEDSIVPKSAERILFCGWRRDMEDMIMVKLQVDYCMLPVLVPLHLCIQFGGGHSQNIF